MGNGDGRALIPVVLHPLQYGVSNLGRVYLVIRQVHQEVMHSDINHTLSMLRERSWILRGRETVKRISKECVVCRRHQARTCGPQPTPDLPRIRVDDAPPFANTGLDFLGPL